MTSSAAVYEQITASVMQTTMQFFYDDNDDDDDADGVWLTSLQTNANLKP